MFRKKRDIPLPTTKIKEDGVRDSDKEATRKKGEIRPETVTDRTFGKGLELLGTDRRV